MKMQIENVKKEMDNMKKEKADAIETRKELETQLKMVEAATKRYFTHKLDKTLF